MAGMSSLSEKMPWTANSQEKMLYIFDTGFQTDATLSLGLQKHKVKVHRFVLEFASPIFHTDFQQTEGNELIIENVNPEIFVKFLRNIYLEECEVAVEECLPLLDIATKYKVQNLIDFCEKKSNENISLENVTRLFQQAMKFGHQPLTEATLVYFCENANELITRHYFLELRQECLFEILKRDDLRVRSELDLFNAVLRWSDAECKRQQLDPEVPGNLGKVLAKVLGLIRFPNMDAEKFTLNVATKSLLGNKELISLLLFFNVPIEKRSNVPQGRFNTTPRKYFKGFDKTKIYSVPRFNETKTLHLFVKPCESLQLKVNKQISLVGFKIFVWSGWNEDVRNDFSNLSCTMTVESVPSGTFLYAKKIKEFNFFETIDLESVELKPNCLYQINLSFDGSYKICHRNGEIYERRYLWNSESLHSSFDFEYKDEERTEKVHFQFSRGDSSELPIDQGIIKELIFTIEE